MFNTPLSQVTYDDVIAFCRTFAEGVRVEYKREVVNTPKVVSSFANTVGGIWVIGVETDKKTNLPILPPIGMDELSGIEERIVQSAQSGIYLPITPAVRVLPIPQQKGRVVVIVKVPESIEASHAIENSTRVWIRTASTTEPYELAEIDRIAYLLERRRQPEQHREDLIERAAGRSPYQLSQRVRVVVAPVYPRGLLLAHDQLYERAQRLQSDVRYLRDFRLVHEAISATGSVGNQKYYFELSVQGVAFTEASAEPANVLGETPFVYLGNLLYPLGTALNTALAFLRDTVTNLLVRYELFRWSGIGYLHADQSEIHMPKEVVREQLCTEQHVAVATTGLAETMVTDRAMVLTELMRQVLWAFNYRTTTDALRGRVVDTAQKISLPL